MLISKMHLRVTLQIISGTKSPSLPSSLPNFPLLSSRTDVGPSWSLSSGSPGTPPTALARKRFTPPPNMMWLREVPPPPASRAGVTTCTAQTSGHLPKALPHRCGARLRPRPPKASSRHWPPCDQMKGRRSRSTPGQVNRDRKSQFNL